MIQAFYSSSTGGKTNDNAVGFGSSTVWPYLQTVDDPWSIDNRVGNSKAAWSYDFSTYQLSKNIYVVILPVLMLLQIFMFQVLQLQVLQLKSQ